jgi:hypothetical protein
MVALFGGRENKRERVLGTRASRDNRRNRYRSLLPCQGKEQSDLSVKAYGLGDPAGKPTFTDFKTLGVKYAASDFRPQQEAEVHLKTGGSILEFPDFVHLCLLHNAPVSQNKLLKLHELSAVHLIHTSANNYRQGGTNSSVTRAVRGRDLVTFAPEPKEERPFGSIIAFD